MLLLEPIGPVPVATAVRMRSLLSGFMTLLEYRPETAHSLPVHQSTSPALSMRHGEHA